MSRKERQRKRESARRARLRRRERRRRAGPSKVLRALTSSALALPGLAPRAMADAPPVDVRSDYRFSHYAEDGISSAKVASGASERYEIDIHQFRFEAPLSDRFDLGLEIAHETMSGATPWYVTPDANGDPVQVMTEATIEESRTDALLSSSYYMGRGKASLSGGFSVENDYSSFNLGLGGERALDAKNTTLSGGVGASFDRIEPSDRKRYPARPAKERKESYDVFVGVSRVLGRNANVQSSLKYAHATGFLSDPYKLAFVAAVPETDRRPDQRNQFAWLTRYRHHLSELSGTLHLDYQFYFDDWDVNAHTLELAWYQTFFERFHLIPSARYYSQSQADFYAPFYARARSDGLRSSDYRLSPYGAFSWKVRAETHFTLGLEMDASLGFERYESDADLALGSVDTENPGLVSYDLFSIGLTARF